MTTTTTTAATPDYDEIVRVVQLYIDGFNDGDIVRGHHSLVARLTAQKRPRGSGSERLRRSPQHLLQSPPDY